MTKPLTVYKASAGSGKTFRLAVEYIKLLIQNPLSYRNTLAVTFTNKATEEMKMRILSQLYGIWRQLPDSNNYMEKVCTELDIPPATASRQAGIALQHLIHNYNYFRVETIDAFFQTVLRNLARELDLTANLRVALNDTQVEQLAVDKLIESLRSSDQILGWIMSYITDNISDDKNWNVIGQIKKFGQTIFKDFYKAESDRLNEVLCQEGFFDNYTKQLRELRTKALNTMSGYADKFDEILSDNQLTPDMLKGKQRGISSYFKKLRGRDWSDAKCVNQTLTQSLEDASNWTSKTSPHYALIVSVADAELIPLLQQAEQARPQMRMLYQSADLTLRYLSQLRLLNSIEQKVRELNQESNCFLLSDTQQLLHSLIDSSDSPFIFEKIGAQLDHVMIDEFQDTSSVQWQNFKVLLGETMSRSSGNLIVGDVKQSIYRWRSGDWRLLNDIEGQFPHPEKQLEVMPLDTNYRSEKNIVVFNNCFFQAAAKLEYEGEYEINPSDAPQLQKAYADVAQQYSENKQNGGCVNIKLLPAKDYDDNMLNEVTSRISELLQAGVPPHKIAILLRSNKHIPLIADHLMQQMPDVRIVSDEAFRLDASTVVSIIVQAMHLLTHPTDHLVRANLVKAWQRQVLCSSHDDNVLFADVTQLDHLLPEPFVSQFDQLAKTPLMELAERLYDIFQLSRLDGESAYACAFFDCVSTFVQDNIPDITHFLTEWDETLSKKTIQSDEVDGIRIISIHKSKGLEFDNVIIPYCDWRLEINGSTLWCEPQEAPFSELPLVPVNRSSRMRDSIYARDYEVEHLQNTVDNLNLLYVAFTRASDNLFVIGQRNNSATRSAIIERVLPLLANEEPLLKGSTLSGDDDKDAIIEFSYGQLKLPVLDADKKSTSNVFLQPIQLRKVKIETFNSPVEFKQSNRSRDFVKGDVDATDQQRQTYIKMGNVLHNVFSTIRTKDDIPQVLRRLEFDGVLYDADISVERIRAMLDRGLSNPMVADWFSGRWQLFNECTILSYDPESRQVVERRPDRVMTDGHEIIVVDFKFGNPHDDYHDQVRGYMQLLSQMGSQHIRGYLWYVYRNQIVTV